MSTFGYSALAVRETLGRDYPRPRLLDRVREAIRTRHYSRRTEKAYVAWIRRYIFFHGKRHPAETGAVEEHYPYGTGFPYDALDGVRFRPAV